MSKFPAWWADTVTIYNRYEDPQTDLITWTRTVLTDCFFKNANNKVTVGQTVIETNDIIVRIPQKTNYRAYATWLMLGNDVRPNYFTIHQGDIIVKGNVTDTIDEYNSATNSNALLTKYKKLGTCLVVNNFNDNATAGRGLKHYRIMGE